MPYEYKSITRWSDEEDTHGTIDMDCGYSCSFHKPIEFGGAEGVLNPEDAFVGSLAMCFSITFKEMAKKMRVEIDDFELGTNGILEEVEGGKMFTKIILKPKIVTDAPEQKIKRALELTEKNCLIARSMKSDIIIEEDIKKG